MDVKNKKLIEMIEYQIINRGIKDQKVIEAFKSIDRKFFVPTNLSDYAYDDIPLSIGHGQTISQPYIVALMTELLELKGYERVLEIGTGSGYQTAILSRLAAEVYTVERIVELLNNAKNNLSKLQFNNIKFFHANGYYGLPDYSPYHRIILTASPRKIPHNFIIQLSNNGILVGPEGDFNQNLIKIKKIDNEIFREEIIPVRFVPLISEE